jgi:predicted dehydrogenase
MDKVRVCIVGMGIGRANGRAFMKNPRSKIVALCDVLEDRMQDFAKEIPNEVKFYTDYKKMCKDPDIDAVFVGTPNQLHVPVALEVLRNDKHVMVTKPLASSLAQAAEVVEVAEKSGLVNMMSLGMRFSNQVQYLGKLRQQGYFGDLYYARAQAIRRSRIPDWSLGFVREGGGAFRDMGVHVLDAVWWLLGMPKPISVTGVAGAKFGPRGKGYWDFRQPDESYWSQFKADDYGGGFIRFENGIGLQVESFWASHQQLDGETQIDLLGTDAGARLRPLTLYQTVNNAPQNVTIDLPAGPDGFDNVAADFVNAILDGDECHAPLRHGMVVQQMMEALLESGKIGREIRFDQ